MSGIYIHIPFCKQRCSYCDFHFSTNYSKYRGDLIKALIEETEIRKNYLGEEQIKSIYFGGGTPSLLNAFEIRSILNVIFENFNVKDPEITLECNPDDITTEKLKSWKTNGVNRLSIGVQSFRDEDLIWMNRAHNAEESLLSIKLANDHGFNNLSIDLIYGTPNLNLSEWEKQLETAYQLGAKHISAYCLTIEQKTELNYLVKQGKFSPASDDQQAEQFEFMIEYLDRLGFEQYEISNFAQPNFESRHNSSYWKGQKYLGIGPSAHSFNGYSRQWNVANNTKYLNGVLNKTLVFEEEALTPEEQFNELILTGLRTKYGVDLLHLSRIKSLNAIFKSSLRNFKENGLIEENTGKIHLTKKGRLLADHVASSLFYEQD